MKYSLYLLTLLCAYVCNPIQGKKVPNVESELGQIQELQTTQQERPEPTLIHGFDNHVTQMDQSQFGSRITRAFLLGLLSFSHNQWVPSFVQGSFQNLAMRLYDFWLDHEHSLEILNNIEPLAESDTE